MRQVLFRGKRIDNGEWVLGYAVKHNECWWIYTGEIAIVEGCINEYGGTLTRSVKYVVDPETVCQYTGLNDKNGKKIFEGDIMIFSAYGLNYIGSVQFVDGNFSIICGQKAAPFLDDAIKRYQAVAVGNIFDNPELLKEVQNG